MREARQRGRETHRLLSRAVGVACASASPATTRHVTAALRRAGAPAGGGPGPPPRLRARSHARIQRKKPLVRLGRRWGHAACQARDMQLAARRRAPRRRRRKRLTTDNPPSLATASRQSTDTNFRRGSAVRDFCFLFLSQTISRSFRSGAKQGERLPTEGRVGVIIVPFLRHGPRSQLRVSPMCGPPRHCGPPARSSACCRSLPACRAPLTRIRAHSSGRACAGSRHVGRRETREGARG